MVFLHCVASFGGLKHLRNAFLQGEESQGEPFFMFPPERGLPGVSNHQILRLRRPVYGRPDAPRAWYRQLSKFIVETMKFEKSILDPALFISTDESGKPNAMLVLHVDDLLAATNGSDEPSITVRTVSVWGMGPCQGQSWRCDILWQGIIGC